MEERPLIPFKSINLDLIAKRIDKVLECTRQHYDTEPIGEAFDSFVKEVYNCFPKDIQYETFYMSMLHVIGQKVTRDFIYQLAWRLAGNVSKLKNRIVVPQYTGQREMEWCPVKIVKANPGKGYDGKEGFFYDYRILAGSAAGLKFTTFWSYKYARFISRSMGFKRTRKINYKFSSGYELVHMMLYLLFDPELSRDAKPGFYHFYVPGTMLKQNQELLQLRFRIRPCPLGLALIDQQCFNCSEGYDRCEAGCHPISYPVKACPRCKEESFYDPADIYNVICINCKNKEFHNKD